MFVGIFKSNQKIIGALLIVLAVILYIPAFWAHEEVYYQEYSILAVFFKSFKNIKWLMTLILIMLISFQALYLNYIITRFRLLKAETYLTAMVFVVLNVLSFSIINLNTIVVANTFILLALNELFKVYNRNNAFSVLFNASFFIALASLVYFPLIVLLPLAIVVLFYTKTPVWRDFIIILIGLVVPYLYVGTYLYLSDSYFDINVLFESHTKILVQPKGYIYFGVLLGGLAFALLSFGNTISRSVVKVKKLLTIILLLIPFVFGMLFLNALDYFATYFVLVIPFAVVFSNFFQSIERKWLAEFLFLILLIAGLANYFL